MLSAYPACFIKEAGGYSVIFPDLNHLATCGQTLEEALSMAIDCLAGYLYVLQKDGESAPPADMHLAAFYVFIQRENENRRPSRTCALGSKD